MNNRNSTPNRIEQHQTFSKIMPKEVTLAVEVLTPRVKKDVPRKDKVDVPLAIGMEDGSDGSCAPSK